MAKMLSTMLFSLAVLSASAVEYTVYNSAGCDRFETEIGPQYSQETMEAATAFIWFFFKQNNPSDRKNVERVSLLVEAIDDNVDGASFESNDQIHVSDRYIRDYTGDLKREITGIIYHEETHVWQWTGNGQAVPDGLIEGIADLVRLRAGYAPRQWVSPGQGDKWDEGYGVTARFLDYCDNLEMSGGTFVAQLNAKMKDGYSDEFFQELLGKSVDRLWTDYKAKYSN